MLAATLSTLLASVLRSPSKARSSKDGGSNAKRPRASQTFDQVNEYKGGAPSKEAGLRKEDGEGQLSRSQPHPGDDDRSTNSMSTGNSDSRQPFREVPPTPGQTLDPRQLEKRQAEEKEYIRSHDSSEASEWYLIDVQWLQAWKHFVTRGAALPGPIDNSRLVDRQTGEPKLGLAAVEDYRGVNSEIWNFWLNRYGGGPVIRRAQLDLYALPPEERKELHLPGVAAPSSSPSAATAPQQRRSPQPPIGVGHTGSSGSAGRSHSGPSGGGGGGGGASGGSETSANSGSSRSMRMFSRTGPRSASSTRGSPKQNGSTGGCGSVTSSQLCCDKCDGPHETDKCPHFKKNREKHQDAWSGYGKTKKGQDPDGDGAPIVRNARVIPQPGDGSCLFHSLCVGLGDQSDATTLRKHICGYIAKNPDMKIADTPIKDWIRYDSNDTVEAYARRMEAGGNWGGGIEMAALTKMKHVNVHVYEKCQEGYKRISAFESPNSKKTVSVLYQGRMHYDAIEVRS